MVEESSLNILGIITARGGSKGIPNKNIRLLAGHPLITYTSRAAEASQRLTRTILSTDDKKIADVGRSSGIEVPFMRPDELARDSTPTLPVIQHALNWLAGEEKYFPDIIVLLQPTAPLRQARHIDEAVDILKVLGSDSVVSITPVPGHYNPDWQFQIKDEWLKLFTGKPLSEITTCRQKLTTTYTRNGAIFAFWYRTLKQYGSIYGTHCVPYIMPSEISVNLDSMDDWYLAEKYLSRK